MPELTDSELNEKAARVVMEFEDSYEFYPSEYMYYAFVLVDKMRELGWEVNIGSMNAEWCAEFFKWSGDLRRAGRAVHTKRTRAITLAAIAAVENTKK